MYQWLLAAHLTVYGSALFGWLTHTAGVKLPFVHIPFYFMQVNAAALWALIRYIQGEWKTVWTPIR